MLFIDHYSVVKDRVSKAEVLSCTGLPSKYTLLSQRRLRWLGHVHRMDDGRIPKDMALALGKRTTGRPRLRNKDVCMRDMKALDIDATSWEEGLGGDRTR